MNRIPKDKSPGRDLRNKNKNWKEIELQEEGKIFLSSVEISKQILYFLLCCFIHWFSLVFLYVSYHRSLVQQPLFFHLLYRCEQDSYAR